MKIVIIGAGAMGGLFAARLAAAGEDVSVVDVWAEHIEMIRTQGLILETEQVDAVEKPPRASVEDAVEKLRYDLYYIKNISILLDLKIILKTISVMLRCQGSR